MTLFGCATHAANHVKRQISIITLCERRKDEQDLMIASVVVLAMYRATESGGELDLSVSVLKEMSEKRKRRYPPIRAEASIISKCQPTLKK